MVATLTTGAPRCLRASGCTSRCSHLCRAAIMSQVRAGGGEKAICGLLPMLTQLHGRRRSALRAFANRGIRHRHHVEAFEQGRAAGLGQLDFLLGPLAGWSPWTAFPPCWRQDLGPDVLVFCGRRRQFAGFGRRRGLLRRGSGRDGESAQNCGCRPAYDVHLGNAPTVSLEIPALRPTRIRIWNWLTRLSYIAQKCGVRECSTVGRIR